MANDNVRVVILDDVTFLEQRTVHHLLLETVNDITNRAHSLELTYAPEGPTERLRESIFKHNPRGFLHDVAVGIVGVDQKVAPHARFVHGGTGIFGPRRSPIVPRRAKYLTFFWHKAGKWMKVKSVRGQPAQPFTAEAFHVLTREYVPYRVERLRAQLRASRLA